MLPTFVCVGPGRTGTSWLYDVLTEHPEVCMAKDIKETEFFDREYHRGFDWYVHFFEECEDAKAIGEISNRYIFNRSVPGRIKKHLSSVKILIGLRNPYERIQSNYSFKLREGALNCSFEEALEKMPALVTENFYYSMIKPYCDLFGIENIFFIFFDDIVSNPEKLCAQLFQFLGVDSSFAPSVLHKKVNAAIVPKFPLVAPITRKTGRLLRALNMHRLLTWAKRSDRIKNILFREYNYKSEGIMSDAALAKIDGMIRPEILKLSHLIGRDLHHWLP